MDTSRFDDRVGNTLLQTSKRFNRKQEADVRLARTYFTGKVETKKNAQERKQKWESWA